MLCDEKPDRLNGEYPPDIRSGFGGSRTSSEDIAMSDHAGCVTIICDRGPGEDVRKKGNM